MFNSIKLAFLKYYKFSFIKALFAALIFLIIHIFSNHEFIRKYAEDFSFDITNKYFINFNDKIFISPKIKVFVVDDKYLKSENLLNKYNEVIYGYTFPRDKIASFIEKLDSYVDSLNENIPKVLFIDYDMTYTTTNYNTELSIEDEKLINVLKKQRKYKIIFPKTNNQNFIENLDDPEIQKLISNKDIIFSSVGLIVSNDDINRRYSPYKEFEDKKYLNITLTIFNMFKDKKLEIEDLTKDDVVENRIIFRDYNKLNVNNDFSYYQSDWANLNKYSANFPLNMIIDEDFKNSIIFFGGSFSQDDVFKNESLLGISDLNGIDVQANALMTKFYLNGKLEKINIFLGLLLVLIIFFFIDLVIEIIFEIFSWQSNKISEFVILLILSGVILLLLSNYILVHYNLWFNWIVPFIIFQLIELAELFKLKSIFNKLKKGKK